MQQLKNKHSIKVSEAYSDFKDFSNLNKDLIKAENTLTSRNANEAARSLEINQHQYKTLDLIPLNVQKSNL